LNRSVSSSSENGHHPPDGYGILADENEGKASFPETKIGRLVTFQSGEALNYSLYPFPLFEPGPGKHESYFLELLQ